MIPAGRRATPQFLNDEFNPFLFAFIGTDRHGASLSVVSALARLDLDAWAEAAMLAGLPRAAAATKLSTRLSKFTEIPRIVQESSAIAARLVALLPNRMAANAGPVTQGSLAIGPSSIGIAALIVISMFLTMYYTYHEAHLPAPVASVSAVASPAPLPPAGVPRP